MALAAEYAFTSPPIPVVGQLAVDFTDSSGPPDLLNLTCYSTTGSLPGKNQCPNWVPNGFAGGSLRFVANQTQQLYLAVQHNSGQDRYGIFSGQPFTVSMWIKPDYDGCRAAGSSNITCSGPMPIITSSPFQVQLDTASRTPTFVYVPGIMRVECCLTVDVPFYKLHRRLPH